jgi:hypothetical protein
MERARWEGVIRSVLDDVVLNRFGASGRLMALLGGSKTLQGTYGKALRAALHEREVDEGMVQDCIAHAASLLERRRHRRGRSVFEPGLDLDRADKLVAYLSAKMRDGRSFVVADFLRHRPDLRAEELPPEDQLSEESDA